MQDDSGNNDKEGYDNDPFRSLCATFLRPEPLQEFLHQTGIPRQDRPVVLLVIGVGGII